MTAIDWQYPATWNVGDQLDEDTLNSRVRDQMTVLLRRPLLIAHNASNVTVTTSTNFRMPFDTIDVDDDGMCVTEGPTYTYFTAQREGTYQVWFNGIMKGVSAFCDWHTCLLINNSTSAGMRWSTQTRMISDNTVYYGHNMSGTVYISAGDTLAIDTWQNSGSTMTYYASNSNPRLAIMWLGVS